MRACEIRFRNAGKRYFFDPLDLEIEVGMFVVVETVRGIEVGEIVSIFEQTDEDFLQKEIKPIIRIATKRDMKDVEDNTAEEQKVIRITKRLVKENKLEMKILASEYTLDRERLVIYFEAESRIDFRQLVKDLTAIYKTRIELRQVGSRDAAKFIGGIGPCGLKTCCTAFIENFDNVSIKMAKNQNLSLNPQKISGSCGKLLCCIKYENDVYENLREDMPEVGDIVKTPDGKGRVVSLQLLKRNVRVLFENGTATNYDVELIKKNDF